MSRVTGWRTAARHVGDNVSVMRLRRLVARGELCATKNVEGVYEFDTDDLDQLKANLRPCGAADCETKPATLPAQPMQSTAAPAAALSASNISVMAATPIGAIPSWLLRAAAKRAEVSTGEIADATPADCDQQSENGKRQSRKYEVVPFATARSRWPGSAVASLWPQGQHQPAGLEAGRREFATRIAQLESQLAAATAAVADWRSLYRSTRARALADLAAYEALIGGIAPEVAQIAAHAAAQALAALTDEQLAQDAVAVPLARQVGHHVVSWAATWQAQAGADCFWPHDGLDRGRHRRHRDRRAVRSR